MKSLNIRLSAIVIAVIMLGFCISTYAAARICIVHLSDGSIIKGELIQQDGENVVLKTVSGVITLESSSIVRMEFEEVEEPAPVSPPVVVMLSVTSDRTNIFEGNSMNSQVIGAVQKGEILEFEEKIDDWYRIIYQDQTGYISASVVEEVEMSTEVTEVTTAPTVLPTEEPPPVPEPEPAQPPTPVEPEEPKSIETNQYPANQGFLDIGIPITLISLKCSGQTRTEVGDSSIDGEYQGVSGFGYGLNLQGGYLFKKLYINGIVEYIFAPMEMTFKAKNGDWSDEPVDHNFQAVRFGAITGYQFTTGKWRPYIDGGVTFNYVMLECFVEDCDIYLKGYGVGILFDAGVNYSFNQHHCIGSGIRFDYYITNILKQSLNDVDYYLLLDYLPLTIQLIHYKYYF